MAKNKSTTASGKNYLNLSLNPYPATYRHQNGDKQIVTKGHEGQTDHEIIITMPQESGTLAVIDGGGTIDLSDYYTKAEVNALLSDKDIELNADYYSKVEVDALLLDVTDNVDLLSDSIDVLGIVVNGNSENIETLQNDVRQNSADILTNKAAHEKNADDISRNKADIAKNKTAISNNTTQIQDLKRRQPIITLWQVGTPLTGAYGNDPAKGEMYMGNGTQVTNNFRDVTELYINFQDYDGQGHTFAQTKVGEVVDIVDGDANKNFGRYTIVSKEAKLDSEKIVVELVSASGTTKVTDVLALQELPVIDGDSVMMKEGGVFTGSIATNKGSISVTSNETTDGNSFDVSNGNGDLHLTVTGDGNFNYYKPSSLVPNDSTVATVKDVNTSVSDKASKSEDNTFNGKQVFNKNITLKGAETSIIPTLSSRWHKVSVNPPKNADGTNNTSDPYGVNFFIDTGHTYKNKFQISNRKGAILEARGGEYPEGQLYKNWSYTGEQSNDNNIATVKSVNTAMSNYAVPLNGNTTKKGNITLQTDSTIPLAIYGADDQPIYVFWKSGAIAIEKPYTSFKDNELVTKSYVDGRMSRSVASNDRIKELEERLESLENKLKNLTKK